MNNDQWSPEVGDDVVLKGKIVEVKRIALGIGPEASYYTVDFGGQGFILPYDLLSLMRREEGE